MPVINRKFFNFNQIVDGVNTVSSSIGLKPSEMRDAQNIDSYPIGGFSKRKGYQPLNSTAVGGNACTGLYMARYSTAGGTNFALLVSGTALYSMSGALGGTWVDKTNGLTITYAANNIWNFDILNDIVVAGNGVDSPIQISSTPTATALTAGLPFTTFKYPVQFRGYMWYFVPTVSGVVKYDRGYFSSINDPTVVGTNNFVDTAVGQGGTIQGAVDYKTFLFVFKRHGIYQINYQPTRVNSSGDLFPFTQFPNPVVAGVGTCSHRSIVKFTTPSTHLSPGQELVFFVDQFGIPRVFDGTTTLSFASKIGTSADSSITSLSDMDKTRNPYCFAINYPSKNRILLFLSSANSQQNVCWVMDYSVGFSFIRYSYALPFNVGFLFEKSNGTFKPYVGDYAGKVHQLDQGTNDNGTAISSYYRSPDIFQTSYGMKTNWFEMEMRGNTGSTFQSVKVDFLLDASGSISKTDSVILFDPSFANAKWGQVTWGNFKWASKSSVTKTTEIGLDSKTLGIKISNSNIDEDFTLEGFSIAAEKLGTSEN